MINNMTLSPHIYILTCTSLDRVSNSVGVLLIYMSLYKRHACFSAVLSVNFEREIKLRNIIILSFAGDVTIPGGMTLTVDSDLNGASPQFTLTCISTGGPATTVTWTRDSEVVVGSTVLDNAETATYTHTLTVIGRLGGDYQCTVSNVKPSSDSASFRIQGTAYMYAQTLTHNVMCM